jgi:hypothetical protein
MWTDTAASSAVGSWNVARCRRLYSMHSPFRSNHKTFKRVADFPAKTNNAPPATGVAAHSLPRHLSEPVEAEPHVDGPRADENAHVRRNHDIPSRTRSSRCSACPSNEAGTRTDLPPTTLTSKRSSVAASTAGRTSMIFASAARTLLAVPIALQRPLPVLQRRLVDTHMLVEFARRTAAALPVGHQLAPFLAAPSHPLQQYPASPHSSAMAIAERIHLAEDLRRHQIGERVRAHRYTPREVVGRWLSRRLLLVVGGSVMLALIAAAALVGAVRVAREGHRGEKTAVALLVEQGRQEALAGNNSRALVYLHEAYRRGDRSAALRFLLATVLRPIEASEQSFEVPAGMPPSSLDMAFSPDGRVLAVAHPQGVSLQDLVAPRELRRLDDPAAGLNHLAFPAMGEGREYKGAPSSVSCCVSGR